MSDNVNKKSILDRLPKSLIKKDNVTIFPEGAMGYLIGPTMAALANSVLASYYNTYMSKVLNINKWAGWFFTWIPVISVVFVIFGNILVGRLIDNNRSSAGKARPLLLLSVPMSLAALLPAGATAVMNDAGAVEYYIDASGSAIYDGLTSYNHWIFLNFISTY